MTPAAVMHWIRPGEASLPRRALRLLLRAWFRFRTRFAVGYASPTEDELLSIERDLRDRGMPCQDLVLDPLEFGRFVSSHPFPADYHGGVDGGVLAEKLLEHFLAWKLLRLDRDDPGTYVDIAAGGSPWARVLRDHCVQAFALDLEIKPPYSGLRYYVAEDATATGFEDGSIQGASLQCAFEMFAGEDDRKLVVELARILAPGGRAIISPLYMHTHACCYQTPEHYGRTASDQDATAYIRRDCWGVPVSRKYSARTLRSRIWETALACGLEPTVLVIRNKREFGDGIYLHFALQLAKPGHPAHGGTE